MINKIELHDSRVQAGVMQETVILTFCPAYVHHWKRSPRGWRGEGRHQSAVIVIAGGRFLSTPGEGPFQISDGCSKSAHSATTTSSPFRSTGREHSEAVSIW